MSESTRQATQVSVVIPYFNSAGTLGRALESVLAQTHPVLEIIVVDDFSSEENRLKLREFTAMSPKIKLIFQAKNTGPASARNTGWDAATGEWIAFLDSDDAWHPRKVEYQLAAIEQSPEPIAMLGTTSKIVDEEVPTTALPTFDMSLVSHVPLSKLLIRNRFNTPSVMLRRNLPYRFPAQRRYSEDFELWLRIASRTNASFTIGLPLTYTFKAAYGASGLSSHMTKMARGELETLRSLRASGDITRAQYFASSSLSILKSAKRLTESAVSGWKQSRKNAGN